MTRFKQAPSFVMGLSPQWLYMEGKVELGEYTNEENIERVFLQICVDPNTEVAVCVPICDARWYSIIEVDACGAVVDLTQGLTDWDQLEAELTPTRQSWLQKVVHAGVPTKTDEHIPSAMLANWKTIGKNENYLPAVATGYLPINQGGRLVTAVLCKPKGIVSISECTTPSSCSSIPNPNVLLHRVSQRAVASVIAGASVGTVLGWLRSGTARKRNRKLKAALMQLEALQHEPRSGPVERRLAIEASRALIPAKVVDRGPKAAVTWIRKQRPSSWKRLRALGTVALLSAVLGKKRKTEAAGAIAATAFDAALAEPDLIGAPEAGMLRARSVSQRERVINVVLKLPNERLNAMTVAQVRQHVLKKFPRALEVLFTDATTGKAYRKRMLMQRLISFPQLLRRTQSP